MGPLENAVSHSVAVSYFSTVCKTFAKPIAKPTGRIPDRPLSGVLFVSWQLPHLNGLILCSKG
jgi:hypothetical protein